MSAALRFLLRPVRGRHDVEIVGVDLQRRDVCNQGKVSPTRDRCALSDFPRQSHGGDMSVRHRSWSFMDFHGTAIERHGTAMGRGSAWQRQGMGMTMPWVAMQVVMTLQQRCHGAAIELPLGCHEYCHETAMGLLWDCHEDAMALS